MDLRFVRAFHCSFSPSTRDPCRSFGIGPPTSMGGRFPTISGRLLPFTALLAPQQGINVEVRRFRASMPYKNRSARSFLPTDCPWQPRSPNWQSSH